MKTYFVRDIKHLFYIIFCDFNFCGPELTAEYRKNWIAAEITGYTVFLFQMLRVHLYYYTCVVYSQRFRNKSCTFIRVLLNRVR